METEPTQLIPQEEKYGAGMLRRFGVFYLLSGMGLLLRRLRMEERSVENIRQASENGHLVYVLYARSRIDWLALNRSLNKRKLPLAVFTPGLRSIWNRPIFDFFKHSFGALKQLFARPNDALYLRQALERKDPCAVFLVQPATLGSTDTEVIQDLAHIQASLKEPIQLVPISVVWNRRPEKLRSETLRFLLGAEDEPGPLQKLLHVINRDHQPIIQAGSPVNLRELLSRYAKNTPNRQARVVRLLLRRYLYRESHVIRGPRIRSYAWSRRLVMDHPDIKKLIQRVAKERNKSEEKIRREVEKTLRHIAARFSFRTIKLMGWVCRFIWSRIYSGIDIGEEDLDRIRDAIRKGTPILIPSHRSHLDYLLLSSVCYENGLVLPHIVAGENLAFPPLGTLFRRCGAFFIRRSFKDEDIFPVVFQSYLRLLMRDEFPIEFFIEGGRSRSGKLLYPKIGVLGMVMDTVGHIRANRDILILPISISYEKIAEEKSYAKELAGTSKTKESVKGVLKATSVLFKRFGKVYIRVDEPISLKQEYTRLPKTWDGLEERQQKEILMGIAEKIIYGIGKKMLILPTGITAMALLSVGKRGVRLQEVQERAGRFDELLRAQGASSADSLSHGGWVVIQALNRFLGEKSIQKIEDEKGEIIRIEDDSRVTLEYYKNGLMHFVGHISMVASALLVEPDTEKAEELFLLQHYLLRYEFFSDPSTDTETLYREILPKLVDYGALEKIEEGYRCVSKPRLKELAGLTQNFLESYLLTLRAASGYRARDISRKELPKKIQEFGKARLAIDEIVRPESLSIANIKNAIRAYREESILQFSIDGSGMKFDEKGLALYCEVLERLIYKSL